MNNKKNILFTATFRTSFIADDIDLLSTRHNLFIIVKSGLQAFMYYLMLIPKIDITYSWFASVYSSVLVFFTKLFNKKSMIVIGGIDVAHIPELNYGIWNSRWKSSVVTYGLRNADCVLAVDDSLRRDAMRLARYDGKNITVVPTGYDSAKWFPSVPKENFIFTAAHCNDDERLRVKGIDFLGRVAHEMQDVTFVLAGVKEGLPVSFSLPKNIKILPFLAHEELLKYYQRAKVYFQPSRREGLPNTLCEAMLCECYPIGTDAGGIPSAIGSAGTVIQYGDIPSAVKSITGALSGNGSASARERIREHFSIQKRTETITAMIDRL